MAKCPHGVTVKEDEVPVMCETCRFFEANTSESGCCAEFDCVVRPDDDCESWERK